MRKVTTTYTVVQGDGDPLLEDVLDQLVEDEVALRRVVRVHVRLDEQALLKEGRKEMFYLTTHSTHYILRLYGVGHMVKDHSDSEKGNPAAST